MPIAISKKNFPVILSSLNNLFSAVKVDAVDRNAVAELALGELIAAIQPLAPVGQDPAEFYRSTCLDGVRVILDQVVEVVPLNQEACLLVVWGAYSFRNQVANPQIEGGRSYNANLIRPTMRLYESKLPSRHAEIMNKYPDMPNYYFGLVESIMN